MRTSTMPTFKKLHRIIQTNLNAGDRIKFTATSRMFDQFRIALSLACQCPPTRPNYLATIIMIVVPFMCIRTLALF
jgi:hypothetical protein